MPATAWTGWTTPRAYRTLLDGGLSPTAVQLVHQVLSNALSDAVADASAKSRRLALDANTVQALRAHRSRQLPERMAWGENWQDLGRVFVREDGSPLNPSILG